MGEHLELVASADVRAAVARIAGLRDLPRLEASFDVTRHGSGGLRVTGRVLATVGQTCVVTLEPLSNEIEEAINLVFSPPVHVEAIAGEGGAPERAVDASAEGPEPLINGRIDLGALATEFLILGLDPYPRKPGAVFEPPPDAGREDGPFAALAELKKGTNDR